MYTASPHFNILRPRNKHLVPFPFLNTLRSVHLQPYNVSTKTFPTSVLQFRLQCCYFYQDQHYPQITTASKQQLTSMGTPLYKLGNHRAMMIRAHRFNTVHFKGLSIRSVSCYTLLREFLLPWPSSDCLNV